MEQSLLCRKPAFTWRAIADRVFNLALKECYRARASRYQARAASNDLRAMPRPSKS